MRIIIRRGRQGGAIIITVALLLLFLLGFMGIAIDFGRLFIVKTELQTATDSCALAAAQELDGAPDALVRATNAGKTVGNLNKVNFQGSASGITDADITFSDSLVGTYSQTFAPIANAKYARCHHTRTGIGPWLLQAMSGFTGDPSYGADNSVFALAIATRASAQTNCALPIGICNKPGGYQKGEWVAGAVNASEAVDGQFRWIDFTGNGGGARELKDLLRGEGQCNLPGTDTVAGKPGNNAGAAHAYNSRFGVYLGANPTLPADGIPDLTGYSWYASTAPTQPYPDKYSAFITKRVGHVAYQGDNTAPDTSGLNTVGSTYSGSLETAGANRRVVLMPIIECADFDALGGTAHVTVIDFACVLLLHPIKPGAGPNAAKMWLEYRGLASEPPSPCSTSGLGGGNGGPLTPLLAR